MTPGLFSSQECLISEERKRRRGRGGGGIAAAVIKSNSTFSHKEKSAHLLCGNSSRPCSFGLHASCVDCLYCSSAIVNTHNNNPNFFLSSPLSISLCVCAFVVVLSHVQCVPT